jgi:hypothetical protein
MFSSFRLMLTDARHAVLISILVFAVVHFGAVPAAVAGITLVQHTSKDAGSTTTSSLAFASSNTAGNWLGVVIRAGASGGNLHGTVQWQYADRLPDNITVDTHGRHQRFTRGGIRKRSEHYNCSQSASATLVRAPQYAGSLSGTVGCDSGHWLVPRRAAETPRRRRGRLLLGGIATANGWTLTAGTSYD